MDIHIYLATYVDNKHHSDHPWSYAVFITDSNQLRESYDVGLDWSDGHSLERYAPTNQIDGVTVTSHLATLFAINDTLNALKPVIEAIRFENLNIKFYTNLASIPSLIQGDIRRCILLSRTKTNGKLTAEQYKQKVKDNSLMLNKRIRSREAVLRLIENAVTVFSKFQGKLDIEGHLLSNKKSVLLRELQYKARQEALFTVGITNYRNKLEKK